MINTQTSSLYTSDVDDEYSPMTLSPSSYSDALSFSLLSLISDVIDLPLIRVPPPLILSETPLRERRGFAEFITITPRSDVHVKNTAKGQIQPTAGSLPTRRRKTPSARRDVVIHTPETSDSEDDN
ncbi:hypothetical protein EV368DRAFT_77440 [Lentinula lateritia]|uniref:Uncharacterized protein n=1 Tax=Lentinula aff. lateritia TaxID=2804960 RepID=A0ACC1U8F6_9AGAR|nr:hypothetical protein F5876DRAFT_73969 [Lentinula aff. lateritia]KAJ3857691.1 hypothetical protein EV368DRAFT_77440 [Lentinula lateritia]